VSNHTPIHHFEVQSARSNSYHLLGWCPKPLDERAALGRCIRGCCMSSKIFETGKPLKKRVRYEKQKRDFFCYIKFRKDSLFTPFSCWSGSYVYFIENSPPYCFIRLVSIMRDRLLQFRIVPTIIVSQKNWDGYRYTQRREYG